MLGIDDSRWLAVLALWVRLTLMWSLGPLASTLKIPPTVSVLFTFTLAASLASAWGLQVTAATNGVGLLILVLREVLLGAVLAFALHAAMATFNLAGRLLDIQMGLSMGAVLDPVTRRQASATSVALSLAGMVFFLTMDGHHAILRGLALSVQSVAPGEAWQWPSAALLLRPVGLMFSLGVVMVAPVLVVVLLVDVLLAVSARAMPQMNVMLVGFSAKILVGWPVLALTLPAMAPVMRRCFAGVFEFWELVLR